MDNSKLKKINCAVIGYGNLGKACKEQILNRTEEFNLTGIFSRRESEDTVLLDKIKDYKDEIDVAIFCGGSSDDAPKMVPQLNEIGLSTVDCFDNHGEILNQNYQNLVKTAANKSGTTAIIGAGWDPGYLSILRIYNKAIMQDGIHHTFYGGKTGGFSMGHTNAIKEIPGVITARQLTVTREDAVCGALKGRFIEKNDRHKRVCFVVTEPGKERFVEDQIRNMPGYFKDQEVEIHFFSVEQFDEMMSKDPHPMSHVGQLISADNNGIINVQLEMNSNPVLTAKAMMAFTKANYRMRQKGMKGAFTIDEVAPAYLVDDDVRLNEI